MQRNKGINWTIAVAEPHAIVYEVRQTEETVLSKPNDDLSVCRGCGEYINSM